MLVGAISLNPENVNLTSLAANIKSDLDSLGVSLDLLVFPECSLTGFYPVDSNRMARNEESIFTDFFGALAQKLHTTILSGAFRTTRLGTTNEAVFFSTHGEQLSRYQKQKLFPLASEDKFVVPGVRPEMLAIGGLRVSPKICYDLRFPNLFYSQSPEIDLFAVIANWPKLRVSHWTSLLKARAIENEAYVLGVNRSGFDSHGQEYDGRPILFDPLGDECDPSLNSELISAWKLNPRNSFKTIGSTRDFNWS